MPPTIAALIPAAGLSSRMGRPKPLLDFGGRTAVELLVASLVGAGLEEIVVVLGPGGEAVAEILGALPVTLAWNRRTGSDMAGSLREGLGHLAGEVSGVVVALADHPLVAVATFSELCAGHRADPALILLPTYQGRKGHPILLPRAILGELARLPTLREVVARAPGRVVDLPVRDPAILIDLDTPADYRQALDFYGGGCRP